MIKKLLLIVIAGVGIYYAYVYHRNPAKIEHPVYAEIRIDVPVGGRRIESVLFGRMVDRQDCEQRAERVWRKALRGCTHCVFKREVCRSGLGTRYSALFNGGRIPTTYVKADRGNRFERSARIVVWGLTDPESREFCETMKKTMHDTYSGTVECVWGQGT